MLQIISNMPELDKISNYKHQIINNIQIPIISYKKSLQPAAK